MSILVFKKVEMFSCSRKIGKRAEKKGNFYIVFFAGCVIRASIRKAHVEKIRFWHKKMTNFFTFFFQKLSEVSENFR